MSEIRDYVGDRALSVQACKAPTRPDRRRLTFHETRSRSRARPVCRFWIQVLFLWDDTDSVRYRAESVSRSPFAFLLFLMLVSFTGYRAGLILLLVSIMHAISMDQLRRWRRWWNLGWRWSEGEVWKK